MSEHKHVEWIKRKDTHVCVECGEVLQINESDFPRDETGLLDWIAIAAMEGYLCRGSREDCKTLVAISYDTAEAMIAERRRRKHE